MFSNAYARLIVETGLNRFLNSFRTQLMLEAKDDPDNVKKVLLLHAKSNPDVLEMINNPNIWEKIWNVAGQIQSFDQRNKQPTMAAFIGGDKPTSYGQLYTLLAKDAKDFLNNGEQVMRVWSNITNLFKAAKGKQVSIKGQEMMVPAQPELFFRMLRDLRFDEIIELASFVEENYMGEEVQAAVASRLPGTEVIAKTGDLVVLKFPKGNNPQTIESLQDVGEFRPKDALPRAGLCTRRTAPDCRAENYLRDNNIYAGITIDASGKPMLEFQGNFETEAQLMDHNNKKYNRPLPKPAFEAILRDIVKRTAANLKMDENQLYEMVSRVIAKAKQS